MFATKCPGQDMRYWTAEDVYEEQCPQCGEMIEFFKTDIRLRCPNCKTRVANPRFDMGCAQWCSYAEQCLGPGAKGLKSKSIRLALEDEFKSKANAYPAVISQFSDLVEEADALCLDKKVDLPPVLAVVLALTLKRLKLIDNVEEYLAEIGERISMPQAILKDAVQLIQRVETQDATGDAEKIVAKLLSALETGVQA
jgi:hypothetical protein